MDTVPAASPVKDLRFLRLVYLWAALFAWFVFVYGQYRLHPTVSFSVFDFVWRSFRSTLPAIHFKFFLLRHLANDLLLACLLQVAARLLGVRLPFMQTAPIWFVLSASFGYLSCLFAGHWQMLWILDAVRVCVFAGATKRLYRFSWGQIMGCWVLAGSLGGGFIVCFGLMRASRVLLNVPWQSLLETPVLRPVDRPVALDWPLRSAAGPTINLQNIRGKFLFVNVWATWCIPCRLELPSLQRLYQHYRNNPQIEFFFVSAEAPTTVSQFLRQHPYALPFYTSDHLPTDFSTGAIPASFIVSPSNRIIAMQEGSMRWDSEAVYRAIDNFLATPNLTGPPLSLAETAIDQSMANRLLRAGLAFAEQGKYRDAETSLSRALFFQRRNAENMGFVRTIYELANVHYQQHQWATAEAFYKQALLLAEQLLKPEDPALANYFNALGCVKYSEGRIAEAEVLHHKAIQLSKNSPSGSERILFLQNYAKDLRQSQRISEAEDIEKQATKLSGRLSKRPS